MLGFFEPLARSSRPSLPFRGVSLIPQLKTAKPAGPRSTVPYFTCLGFCCYYLTYIHLCIDPKDLNEALEREPYYSRTIDELISMFAGAKVFTIVDMGKGYWQVVLHPESRKLTCMAFDIGRYQFNRLPMGSKVASNIFQRMLDSVYIGLPGVTGIADDMVIFGRNEEEHDRNLILFLETTRKNGLILNKRKLQFKKEEVSFFGHRWNSTDPKKTESILKMQTG